jgi:lipoic acid synthetase
MQENGGTPHLAPHDAAGRVFPEQTPGVIPSGGPVFLRKPAWLRTGLAGGAATAAVRRTLREGGLSSVCEQARCPNLAECWEQHRTATFLLLGEVCTRGCRFCAVACGAPAPPVPDEAERVAEAAARLGLRHVVLTMVTRDDLPDGGAAQLVAAVSAVRSRLPESRIEVLLSDLGGVAASLRTVARSGADILGHNLETVRRLSPQVRPRADYDRSLAALAILAQAAPQARIKSALLAGMGETDDELLEAVDDLYAAGVRILNIGQYLQPGRDHHPVARYLEPAAFDRLRIAVLARGFTACAAGPLVRSSYHAAEDAHRIFG